MKHFKENKDVAFYADKLCITSKYLTMVIKETSGKSAKDWIVEYVILEIKTLLKNTNMNIQEIAIRTNFAKVFARTFLQKTYGNVAFSVSNVSLGLRELNSHTLTVKVQHFKDGILIGSLVDTDVSDVFQ